MNEREKEEYAPFWTAIAQPIQAGLVIATVCALVSCTETPSENPSDASADSDARDTLVYIPKPPESLGPGFIEISGPILDDPPFSVDPFNDEEKRFPNKTSGVFGDLDGDGLPEVIISNHGWHPREQRAAVYHYDPASGSLIHSPEDSNRLLTVWGLVPQVIDLDGDGYSDVIGDIAPDQIVWGNADGVFNDPSSFPVAENYRFEFHHDGAVHLADIDSDGWIDILLGDGRCEDGGGSFNILLQNGPRSFVSRMDLIGDQHPPGEPYAALAVPIRPDETILFAIGGACNNAIANEPIHRLDHLDEGGYPVFSAFDPTPLDSPYKAKDYVSYAPMSVARPMGAAVTDIDADGILDMAVTLSGCYALFRGQEEWPFVDVSSGSGLVPPASSSDEMMIGWGMALLDLDKDGLPEFLSVHGSGEDYSWGPDGNTPEWLGKQHTVTFWNGGDFRFTEITEITGLKELGNWRSLAVGDLDADGDPDLIVGGMNELPRVYRNDIEVDNRGFAIKLRGTTSNHLGIGALIEVDTDGATPKRLQLMGNVANPLATSEPIVFVGLGHADAAKTIRITWPSGWIQEVHDVAAGSLHTFEEEPTLTVNSETRHVPADGKSTVEIHVTPRGVDGSVLRNAKVTIAAAFGPGDFAGPTTRNGDSWTRTLVAPDEPSSTVIEASIDGSPIKVRPRIWWD